MAQQGGSEVNKSLPLSLLLTQSLYWDLRSATQEAKGAR